MRNSIRLFVSSTFQDMGAERDLLNRIVFPYLKEYCRKKGLGFNGVDLRWGITVEDASAKKTVEICFDEIDRCRPYFAGIIGNRYGWIPPAEYLSGIDRKTEANISVTEAEMRYGALDQGPARAIFCIKASDTGDSGSSGGSDNLGDSGNSGSSGDSGNSGSSGDSGDSGEPELNRLKQQVRAANYPLLDGYQSPDEIADFFISELTRIIDKDYPDEIIMDRYQSEYSRQRNYLIESASGFVGRTDELKQLADFVSKNSGVLLLDGAEGCGKTALLAQYLQGTSNNSLHTALRPICPSTALAHGDISSASPAVRRLDLEQIDSQSSVQAVIRGSLQEHEKTEPGDFVYFCFSEALLSADEWSFSIRRLIGELKNQLDGSGDEDSKNSKADKNAKAATQHPLHDHKANTFAQTSDIGELIAELPSILKSAAKNFNRVIIIFDGIEALTAGHKFGLSWIPERLPANVRMVLTTHDTKTKALLENRNYKVFELPTLRETESRDLIRTYLAQYGKKLEPEFTQEILSCKQSSDPNFLKVLLSELVVWGGFESLGDKLSVCLSSQSLAELCEKVFSRLESEYGKALTADTFIYLYLSKDGLKENELLCALGKTQGEWMPLYYAIKSFLFESEDVLYLTNSEFRAAVRERYLSTEATNRYQRRLINVFSRSEFYDRGLQLLPEIYLSTRRYSPLARQLRDPKRFSDLWLKNSGAVLRYHGLLTKSYKGYDKKALADAALTKNSSKKGETPLADGHTQGQAPCAAGQPMAAERCEPQPQHGPIQNQVPCAVLLHCAEFYQQIGEPAIAVDLLESMLKRPDITDGELLPGLSLKGNLQYRSGNYQMAKRTFDQKRKLCLKLGNTLELARANASLGQISYTELDFAKAITKFNAAKRLFQKSGHPYGLQAAFGNLGNAYFKSGDFAKAKTMYLKQERLCKETSYKGGLITALGGQFLICLHDANETNSSQAQTQLQEAQKILEQQRVFCLEIDALESLQTVIGNQAVVAYQLGDYQQAKTLLLQKYDLAVRLGSFEGQNNALANLADLLGKESYQKNSDDVIFAAIEFAKKRASLCRKMKNPRELSDALYRLAYLLRMADRTDEADLAEMEAGAIVAMHGMKQIDDQENYLFVR